MTEQYTDYDSPWKEMLEKYLEEFMAFFFPDVHQGIDWKTEYLFLDKKLQQVVRDAELGRRLVDKLVRVVKKDNGDDIWVFVHVEVQGFYDIEFEKRMYVYNYRLFDRYERPICSLVVLADEREKWRPEQFRYEMWGCEASLKFPVVKLLDYQHREDELEGNSNPFAIVVLSFLKTRATRKNSEDRLQWKLRIFKMLYERGYSKEDILELARFIDWIMVLPEDLEQRFDEAIAQFEEEQNMQYVTSFERQGIKKGMQQGLQQGFQQGLLEKSREDVVEILQTRFENIPQTFIVSINRIADLVKLKDLLKKVVTVNNLDEFQKFLESED